MSRLHGPSETGSHASDGADSLGRLGAPPRGPRLWSASVCLSVGVICVAFLGCVRAEQALRSESPGGCLGVVSIHVTAAEAAGNSLVVVELLGKRIRIGDDGDRGGAVGLRDVIEEAVMGGIVDLNETRFNVIAGVGVGFESLVPVLDALYELQPSHVSFDVSAEQQ